MLNERWVLTEEERQTYMNALAEELAPLRAKAGISQVELCNLIGISRQTYSAIEGRKRAMTWSTYLSLILFFDRHRGTREMLRHLKAYPEELFLRINGGEPYEDSLFGGASADFEKVWETLDEQARHSIKTMLLMEYARCARIPGDVVVKAFDGKTFFGGSPDAATERALKNIRERHERAGY